MHKTKTTAKIIKIAKSVERITKLTDGTPLFDVGAGVLDGSDFTKENKENKTKINIFFLLNRKVTIFTKFLILYFMKEKFLQ